MFEQDSYYSQYMDPITKCVRETLEKKRPTKIGNIDEILTNANDKNVMSAPNFNGTLSWCLEFRGSHTAQQTVIKTAVETNSMANA